MLANVGRNVASVSRSTEDFIVCSNCVLSSLVLIYGSSHRVRRPSDLLVPPRHHRLHEVVGLLHLRPQPAELHRRALLRRLHLGHVVREPGESVHEARANFTVLVLGVASIFKN